MGIGDIPPTNERTVAGTETSFEIIEALKRLNGAGVTELATDLGIAKGTVHKHLSTLRQLDYVVKDDDTYRLSISFLGLGTFARSRVELHTYSQQPVKKLMETIEETVSIMISEHGFGIYLTQVVPDDRTAPPIDVGEHVPLHATAGGKAILAYTPKPERERILDHRGLSSQTANTTTDREAFIEELQTVHDRRIAYDREEHIEGWCCIARPITNERREAVGAVIVSVHKKQLGTKLSNTDIPNIIGSTADSIQNRLRSV